MLSPNAKNDVAASVGGGTSDSTVIRNEQASVLCSASVATHDTLVFPMPNEDPDAGAQAVVTGSFPLIVVGLEYVTETDVTLVVSWIVCGAGQVIFGGSSVGTGVGPVLLEHAPAASALAMTTNS